MQEMDRLYQIQEQVRDRAANVVEAHGDWPCRKGCDDCCRHLASVPRVTREEWLPIADAIDALPATAVEMVRARVRASAGAMRPVVCPLLDSDSGACLIYDARPVACRSYGFYAEREKVLGCHRIEVIAGESPEVVWGNHESLEERLRQMGPAHELWEWLA
ncbi:MAG TPA: YkgJ family cysteine cluster protein [Bryobacteraceae bacterium]|nr:YkgJ family cysteine cluster protein [Bryobacteraceae bacterium]